MSVRAPEHGQNEENCEGQNQHDNGSLPMSTRALTMDKKKRTVNDKISMMMAPAYIREVI